MTQRAASPLIADIQTVDNEKIKVFGSKDSNGIASTVDRVEYNDGTNNLSYDIDSEQRIVAADADDGTHFSFKWTGNYVDAIISSSDGQIFTLPLSNYLTASSVNADRTSSLSAMAISNTATATAMVSRCNKPKDADIYFDIFDSSTGVVARSIKARLLSAGSYVADIPRQVNDFDVDFKTRENAELAARTLTKICAGDARTLSILSNVCSAASAPGLGIPDRRLRVTCILIKGMNAYCKLVGNSSGEELVQKIINNLPDKVSFFSPSLSVRARVISVPSSVLSDAIPLISSIFSFSINLGNTCPKLAFSQVYNANLYWYVDGRLVAVVPPNSERVVDLGNIVSGRHALSVSGELIRTTFPGETAETAQYLPFPLLIKSVSDVSLYTESGQNISQTPAYGAGMIIGTINLGNYVNHPPTGGVRDAGYYIMIN